MLKLVTKVLKEVHKRRNCSFVNVFFILLTAKYALIFLFVCKIFQLLPQNTIKSQNTFNIFIIQSHKIYRNSINPI